MWETTYFEARQSFRGWRESPAFALLFIGTMAVSLGATLITASLLEAIVFRTVIAQTPERLVALSVTDPATRQAGYIYSDTLEVFRNSQESFAKLSMYSTRMVRVEGKTAVSDAVIEGVTEEYFDALGTWPISGRFFTSADRDSFAVAVISERFRQRLLGSKASAIGETLEVDGLPLTVVGVTAPGFAGLQFDGGADLFVPIAMFQNISRDRSKSARSRNVIGQLRPGVDLTEAKAELLAVWSGLQQSTVPSWLPPTEQQSIIGQQIDIATISKGFSTLRLRFATPILTLVALTVTLLAIAGVNLAGLLLARTLARRHQFATLLALGATGRRVMHRILFESVFLTCLGFLLSLPFVWSVTRAIGAMLAYGRGTPLIQNLTPSFPLLIATALLAIIVGLAIGIGPAWRAVRSGVNSESHQQRVVVSGLGRTGRLLLTVQVSLSMMLLIGAVLFTRTLAELRSGVADLHHRNVAFTRLARIPGDRRPIPSTYWRSIVTKLGEIEGVESAALSVSFPAYFEFPETAPTDRYAAIRSTASGISAVTEFVSPMFFQTVGIPLLKGRDFSWADREGNQPVAIVNRATARSVFGESEPVGSFVSVGSGSDARELFVVGVAEDAPVGSLRESHQPAVFRPILQEPIRAQFPMAHVRYQGETDAVRAGYVKAVDSEGLHFVRTLFTLSDWTDSALMKERMIATLSTFVGVLTVVLACIGVYATLAYAVNTRVREIGVRLALGATRNVIARMVVCEGLAIGIPGIVIGIMAAMASVQVLRSQFFGVEPRDPWVLATAALALIAIVMMASALPAMRASRTDPTEALRHQ